jgi:hypothetical protein
MIRKTPPSDCVKMPLLQIPRLSTCSMPEIAGAIESSSDGGDLCLQQ